MIDFSFIRNRLPENTPVKFRRKHMKGFLGITMEEGNENYALFEFALG